MDDRALDRLFTGDMDQLVHLPKRVVRLFISSTFTDMSLERNSLMERVYPRLKKYCRERHGLDFQVVDMRWGVRDEATDDHQTANLCSREIDNCQRMSLGPNFVALIGDKYGFRPLCNKIKSTEYRALRRCLIELDIATDFLDTWYKEDLNAVPAEYLLQPISSILKNFTNKDEPELQALDQRHWQSIQQRLHELLMIGSNRLVEQGRMSEQEQLMKYSISVTEREVIEGCLNVKEARSCCLVYVRSIVDIREQLSRCLASNAPLQQQQQLNTTSTVVGIEGGSTKAAGAQDKISTSDGNGRDLRDRRASVVVQEGGTINLITTKGGGLAKTERRAERIRRLLAKYIDLSSKEGSPPNQQWSLDEEAQSLLGHLRAVKLEAKLLAEDQSSSSSSSKTPARALSKFKVLWDESEGISLKSDEHKRYLNDLTDHFYTNMTKMIRRASSRDDQEFKTGLIGEILQHSHYAKHVSRSFYGRSTELDRIRAYILTSTTSSVEAHAALDLEETISPIIASDLMPMFVYGVGGSGKTSVLARAASLAKEWIERARSLESGAASLARDGGVSTNNNEWNSADSTGQARDERWDQRPCIIMRFCGTTPSSSSMVGVLTSVCRQLQYNFYQFGPLNGLMNQETGGGGGGAKAAGKRAEELLPQLPYEPVGEDFVRLVFTFRQLVENCRHHYHRGRLFLIILDSIERLSSPAESSVEVKYSWLTSLTKLPSNVRLIVSCSSERGAPDSQLPKAQSSDFIHLKRHFLRLYFPLDTHLRADVAAATAATEHLASPTKSFDSANAAADDQMDHFNPESGSDATLATNYERRPRESLANHLLKRLVLPALRLRRGSQKLPSLEVASFAAASNDPDSNEAHLHLRRSATSLGLESGSISPKTVANTKVAKLIGCSSDVDQTPSPRLSCTSRLGSAEPLSVSQAASSIDDNNEPQQLRQQRHSSNRTINMIHVRPMGVDLAQNVVRLWLQELGRTLTQQQWAIVRRSFAQCSRPIFVKLAFGEIVNWKSYSVQSDSKGLTFGSSLLDKAKMRATLAKEASNDPNLRFLMNHYEKPSSVSATSGGSQEQPAQQFKRQILNVEREWLNYLAYSQRKCIDQTGSGVGLKIDQASQKDTTIQQMQRGGGGGGGGGGLNTNICHLSSSIDEAVSQLFARIELQHGYLLTKHSLSYITAARNGICENELEDILSLDDVVLDDVFQYHLPPVRRIPPLLWTRIRNDLPDYLSERDADGIVVNWHHSQFELVARRRYLQDPRQIRYIHSNMADYFLGRWADQAKPFRCTKQQILMAAEQLESAIQQSLRDSVSPSSPMGTSFASGSRSMAASGGRSGQRLRSSEQSDRSTNWMQAKADRRVPHQPLHYGSLVGVATSGNQSGPQKLQSSNDRRNSAKLVDAPAAAAESTQKFQRRRYNLRKLTELPFHLMRSGRFLDLANEVLFNYRWLYAAIEATGLQSLLSDFQEASKSLDIALSVKLDNTGKLEKQQTVESSHWSTSGSSRKRDEQLDASALKSMISQLNVLNNTIRLSSSSIHSDTQMLAPQLIGRLLPLTRSLSGEHAKREQVKYLIQLMDQCDRDGCLDCALLPTDHCLQAPDGLQLSSLEGHSFAIMSMSMASDGRHLLAVSNRFIMWDTSTGEISRDIDPKCEGAMIMELKLASNDEYALAYTSSNTILVLDILTQQVVKFETTGCLNEDEKIMGLELVDLFTGSEFIVWTQERWLLLKLVKSELLRSAPQRVTIELQQSVELASLELDMINNQLSLLDIRRVHHDGTANLTFVEVVRVDSGELQLLTISRDPRGLHKLWDRPEVASPIGSFCLDSSLRQLVVSNNRGDLFLVRRRSTRWSRPKLIWSKRETNLNVSSHQDSVENLSRIHMTPLAIELKSEKIADGSKLSSNIKVGANLASFERRIDGVQMDDELPALDEHLLSISTDSSSSQLFSLSHVKLVLIYLSDRIVVLRLETQTKSQQQQQLLLPRDVRNISVKPNRCQIRAILLSDPHHQVNCREEFLAAAVGRRLLLYTLKGEGQFLRSIDAHAARIVQLSPIIIDTSNNHQATTLDHQDDRWLSFASASIDKTVKIWNLTNLHKDVHTLDKLDNPIESMSIAKQRPWVACLGRSELGLWDWRSLKLLCRFTQHDILLHLTPNDSTLNQQRTSGSCRLVKCRLSSDGSQLCLATLDRILLFSVEELSSSKTDDATGSGQHLGLVFSWQHKLSATDKCLVRGFRFFQQDSRLLSSVECPLNSHPAQQEIPNEEEDALTSSSAVTGREQQELPFARRLLILCHSIPDGRLLYTIDSITPSLHHHTASSRAHHNGASSGGIRLPVLTRDQLHVVTVETTSGEAQQANAITVLRKRSSSAVKSLTTNTLLGVYSARDGLLLRRINLSQLEPYNQMRPPEAQQPLPPPPQLSSRKRQSVTSGLLDNLMLPNNQQQQPAVCSIAGEQFSRLKPVASYRERQSVVALLDHERSTSFLVDVNTRQLMACSSIWNGKLSSNGRFGLSRMFKSSGSLRATAAPSAISTVSTAAAAATKHTATKTTTTTTGLQLLEMSHCSPIKALLTHETLVRLSNNWRHTTTTTSGSANHGHTGNDADITCGFAGPSDSHVYYHDSRLTRLLLIRVSDGHLVANYKLPMRVTKIKCSPDGYALVLSLSDGSLTSLAIVDPQKDDTVVRLAQYPSRKRPPS